MERLKALEELVGAAMLGDYTMLVAVQQRLMQVEAAAGGASEVEELERKHGGYQNAPPSSAAAWYHTKCH